jgi:ligand-binding sensor domain-containing protein
MKPFFCLWCILLIGCSPAAEQQSPRNEQPRFESLSTGLRGNEGIIFQIVPDFDGTMWIATDKGALHVFTDGKVEKYDESKGLNADHVTQVVIAPDGSKWFVHSGVWQDGNSTIYSSVGATRLRKDGQIEAIGFDRDLRKDSKDWVINHIAFDLDKSTWLAANVGAVHLLNNGQIEVFGEEDFGEKMSEISLFPIEYIFIDSVGWKWFATNKGLASIDIGGRITTYYPTKQP